MQGTPLNNGIFPRQPNAFFGFPDHDVEARHFGGQDHQEIVIVGDGGAQGGVRGFDGARELAPEIELPGGVDAHGKILERVVEVAQVRPVPAGVVVGIAAYRVLNLRIERADRDAELCARLEHAQAGRLQSPVLPIGGLDEPGKDRVFEDIPPSGELRGIGLDPVVTLFEPIVLHGCFGRLEIRPDLHASTERKQ